MKRLFFGGVHPNDKKAMSTGSAELKSIIPKQVIIPLRQHIGAICEPLVRIGDRVRVGEKIGDGEGLCVPVHSSVSGRVTAIEKRPHPGGEPVMAIVIENDLTDEAVEYKALDTPTDELDSDTVLHMIREAGIVGMGGAAFPGDVKALSSLGKIDTLIANASECEPYITSDDMMIRTNPKQVLEGMMIIRHILKPERTVLAIEDNKAEAIKILSDLRGEYPEIEVVVLPTRYPQGGEKQLVQAVTGRQVPPAGLPSSVGCVVFNVSTFAAIYRAVRLGMPLVERIVTATGEGISEPQNFKVRIGTPFADILYAAGGLKDGASRVISGGPMMGNAQGTTDVPVIKATNSILCLPEDNTLVAKELVCIRCGKCLSACPMKLQPLYIFRYARAGRADRLVRLNVTDCMECGCCAYTCPARIPLVEGCRIGKKLVKEAAEK